MNCQNFENIITDLARDIMMDAATRESARAHTQDCAPCAARLAGERALSTCLRRAFALDATGEAEHASPRVESALLSAFRERRAALPTGALQDATTIAQASSQMTQEALPSASPAVSDTRADAPASIQAHVEAKVRAAARARQSSFWRFAAVAAAVVVVALLSLSAARLSQPEELPEGMGEARRQATNIDAPSSVAATDAQAFESPETNTAMEAGGAGRQSIINPRVAGLIEEKAEAEAGAIRQPALMRAATPRTNVRQNNAGYSNAGLNSDARAGREPLRSSRAATAAGNQNETEIATDFFPIAGAMTLMQTDSGHIVRVELPRSALASFGLPVNTERNSERVKADVLFGDDGIARAIRFVR